MPFRVILIQKDLSALVKLLVIQIPLSLSRDISKAVIIKSLDAINIHHIDIAASKGVFVGLTSLKKSAIS